MTASTAVDTLGTTLTINATAVGQIQDVSGPELSTDTDEITNHSSPNNTEEFIATIKRTGEISFPLVFNPGDTGHEALFTAWNSRSKDSYALTYPDGSGWTFDAYCVGFSMSAPVAGHLSADITLRPSSAPTRVTGS